MALACASLVMVALLLVTDDRMLARLLDTDSERPVTPRRFMLRVEEAAQTHGLTAKETEVLVLAAKGRATSASARSSASPPVRPTPIWPTSTKSSTSTTASSSSTYSKTSSSNGGGPRSCMFYRGIKLSATNPKKGPRQCPSMPHRTEPNAMTADDLASLAVVFGVLSRAFWEEPQNGIVSDLSDALPELARAPFATAAPLGAADLARALEAYRENPQEQMGLFKQDRAYLFSRDRLQPYLSLRVGLPHGRPYALWTHDRTGQGRLRAPWPEL